MFALNAVPKPDFKRGKPKRGNYTKFSLKTRRAIVKRDSGLCVRCMRTYNSIHHVQFASNLGSGTEDNGVCVCTTCHELAHKKRDVRIWFEKYKAEFLLGGGHDEK